MRAKRTRRARALSTPRLCVLWLLAIAAAFAPLSTSRALFDHRPRVRGQAVRWMPQRTEAVLAPGGDSRQQVVRLTNMTGYTWEAVQLTTSADAQTTLLGALQVRVLSCSRRWRRVRDDSFVCTGLVTDLTGWQTAAATIELASLESRRRGGSDDLRIEHSLTGSLEPEQGANTVLHTSLTMIEDA